MRALAGEGGLGEGGGCEGGGAEGEEAEAPPPPPPPESVQHNLVDAMLATYPELASMLGAEPSLAQLKQLLGSYSQLFVKVICAAIVEAADPASTVVEVDVAQLWLLWLSVGLLVLVAPIQLILLTGALRAGKASFAVPAYTSMLVPLTIVLDGVYFRAISCWSRDTIIVYVTTLVVLIVGVLLLACQQDRGDEGKVGIVGVDDESPGQSDYEEAEEEPARPMPTAVEPAKMVADLLAGFDELGQDFGLPARA